jgi:hypothetical protein
MAGASTWSRLVPLENSAEPLNQNLMSSKELPLLPYPKDANLRDGDSLVAEDSNPRGLNVEIKRMFPASNDDRILLPPRRAFKKSRKGCRTCKARKVKVRREPQSHLPRNACLQVIV